MSWPAPPPSPPRPKGHLNGTPVPPSLDMRLGRRPVTAAQPPVEPTWRQTAAVPGRFRFHRAADRLDDIPDIEFDIAGYRIRPTFGTTAGELKTLKSTLVMAVSVAQVAGVAALGHFAVPTPRPVLYVVGEGGEIPFRRRLARIRDAYGISSGDLAHLAYTTDTAPLTDPGFRDSILDQLDQLERDSGTTGTVIVDPKYAVHPASVDARNLHDEGAMLRAVTAPLADAGWSFDLVDHYNQTGSGNGLKRVTMAGAGEWADSWTLLAHREAPDVDAGRFRLEMAVGSRQWGGATWWVDFDLGRFNIDTLEHDGDMTWTVRRPAADRVDTSAEEDAAVAVNILGVLRRSKRSVTRSDVVDRVKGRAADTRRVLAEMLDDGRLSERSEPYVDSRGRNQHRQVIDAHEGLANVTTLRPTERS